MPIQRSFTHTFFTQCNGLTSPKGQMLEQVYTKTKKIIVLSWFPWNLCTWNKS